MMYVLYWLVVQILIELTNYLSTLKYRYFAFNLLWSSVSIFPQRTPVPSTNGNESAVVKKEEPSEEEGSEWDVSQLVSMLETQVSKLDKQLE